MSAEDEYRKYRLRPHRSTEMAFQQIRADGLGEDQDDRLTKIEKNYARLMVLCDKFVGELHGLREEIVRSTRKEISP